MLGDYLVAYLRAVVRARLGGADHFRLADPEIAQYAHSLLRLLDRDHKRFSKVTDRCLERSCAVNVLSKITSCLSGLHNFGWSGVPNRPIALPGIRDYQ